MASILLALRDRPAPARGSGLRHAPPWPPSRGRCQRTSPRAHGRQPGCTHQPDVPVPITATFAASPLVRESSGVIQPHYPLLRSGSLPYGGTEKKGAAPERGFCCRLPSSVFRLPSCSCFLPAAVCAVPDQGASQALLEADLGVETEVGARLGDVGAAAVGVVDQVLLLGALPEDDFALIPGLRPSLATFSARSAMDVSGPSMPTLYGSPARPCPAPGSSRSRRRPRSRRSWSATRPSTGPGHARRSCCAPSRRWRDHR